MATKDTLLGNLKVPLGTSTLLTWEKGRSRDMELQRLQRIDASETFDQIKIKIAKFLHEINETYKYSKHGIIARHADIKICHGAPFVYSRKRDRTLQDVLHEDPLSETESASIVIQLAHGLAYCSSKGLSSHQDMKPENILADRVRDHFGVPDDYTLVHRVFICDFGMANAFRVFGKTFGSRPYMAPEQYGNPETLAKADVFALRVIMHELISGFHPIGEVTRDLWPIPLAEKGKITAENLKLLLTTYDGYAIVGEQSGWPYYEHLLDELNQTDLG